MESSSYLAREQYVSELAKLLRSELESLKDKVENEKD